MRATVLVRPKQGILDPQGQAVEQSLRKLGFAVAQARVGRVVDVDVDAASVEEAREVAGLQDGWAVDPASAPYLKGATVDFVESLQESGFKIENPNASGSCGCGHSFQVADGDEAHAGCSH